MSLCLGLFFLAGIIIISECILIDEIYKNYCFLIKIFITLLVYGLGCFFIYHFFTNPPDLHTILISILTIIVTLFINNVIISTRNKYIEIKSKLLSCKQKADLLKIKIDKYNTENEKGKINKEKINSAEERTKILFSTPKLLDNFYNIFWEDERIGIIENYKELINNIKSISFELAAIYEVHPKSSHLNKEEINKIKEDLFRCDIKFFALKHLKDTCEQIIKVLNDTIDKIKI